MSEENEELELTEEEKTNLLQKGLLFEQLLQSDKFLSFFQLNYDLVRNEEEKALFLVEVPDEEAMKRAAAGLKKQALDKRTAIQPATMSDLKKIERK